MTSLSTKRANRIENKKKKMAALYQVVKLNDFDRASKNTQMTVDESGAEGTEPSPKKARLHDQPPVEVEEGPLLSKTGLPLLSGEQFLELKQRLRMKTNAMRAAPKFRLREQGENAALCTNFDERVPLFMSDIQHLIMYSQIGHHSPYSPNRWCQLEKFNKIINTNILIIDNLSLYDFVSNESVFPYLSSTYEHKLELLTPNAYNGDSIRDLATVPLTSTQMRKYINKFGSLEDAVVQTNDVFDLVNNLFPKDAENSEVVTHSSGPKCDKFPRTLLLLSGWQMVEENFPLPIKGLMDSKYKGYVLTKDVYKDVTANSPMYAIDCEMCMTTLKDLELTRVSVVDEDRQIVYEQLVKPDNKIIDYLTKFSGITAKLMRPVTKRLKDVQEDLRKVLPPDAILVGQSLSNDMHALKMFHPYIIDTSIIFNITGDRLRKTKLATLSNEFLSEKIQESSGGHCSVEDSLACLKLVQLKLKKSIYFGDAVMSDLQLQVKRHPELGTHKHATSMLKQTTRMERNAFIVGLEEIASKYMYYTFKELKVKSDEKIVFVEERTNNDVIKKVTENVTKNSLNIAHVRLENRSEATDAKLFGDVDDWVRQMRVSGAAPSLNIVLFTGLKEGGNGCCFIDLKS